MSIGLYLAVGHGITPAGHLDPGAVSGKHVEHTLAFQACAAMAHALQRSGYTDFAWESAAGAGHDPNFVGSAARANALGAAWCMEVHLNAGGGTGPETLIYSLTGNAQTKAWAERCQHALVTSLGLPDRGVKARPDLYWLTHTHGHAVLVELLFVDGDGHYLDTHPGAMTVAGEALAHAFLNMLGHPWVGPC